VVAGRPVVGRRVDLRGRDVGVEQRAELPVERRVDEREPLVQVVAEPGHRTVRGDQLPVQPDPVTREPAQVDVVSTVHTGQLRDAGEPGGRRRQVRHRGERDADLGAVQEGLQQPPDHVAAAVPARRRRAHRHRHVHLAPGPVQVLDELRAGLAGTDHEHAAVR
jgi:hypothetical protein